MREKLLKSARTLGSDMPNEAEARELGVLLATMVVAIAKNKAEVEVEVDRRSHRVVLFLRTADSDAGLIIGPKGRTIDAIRTVMFSAARAREVMLDIEYLNDRHR